jgi:hypothetical protein
VPRAYWFLQRFFKDILGRRLPRALPQGDGRLFLWGQFGALLLIGQLVPFLRHLE